MPTPPKAPAAKKAAADPRDAAGSTATPSTQHNPLAPPGAAGKLPTSTSGAEPPQPRKRARVQDLVSVTVHTPFKLTDDDGVQHHYHAGTQDVPREHADHWYAAHHLEKNED